MSNSPERIKFLHDQSKADITKLKIRTCPFCNQLPVTYGTGNSAAMTIECITPECVNPRLLNCEREWAVKAWNKRGNK